MDNLVLFSAYAKLPAGMAVSEIFKVVGVILVIDVTTDIIKEADCTLTTQVARNHVTRTMMGYNLSMGIDDLIHSIDKTYHGGAKKAIITSLRIIYDKYTVFKSNKPIIE